MFECNYFIIIMNLIIFFPSLFPQDFLTDIVLEAYTEVWIGLRSIESGTVFHWSDDSRMDFTNWNANEPQFHSVSFETLRDYFHAHFLILFVLNCLSAAASI